MALNWIEGGGDGPLLLCLHGFGDNAGMYEPLLETALVSTMRVVAPDLPGCGASEPDPSARTIDGQARRLAAFVGELGHNGPVVLVGHSVASAVAVATLGYLGGRGAGLFSIEGNLTSRDAYFSGLASRFDEPLGFHAHLLKGSRNMVNFKPELTRYADALERAHASTLWHLGRDAHTLGADDQFGRAYRELRIPTLYYWCRASTPESTRSYLSAHRLNQREYTQGGHWPTVAVPEKTAQAIGAFVASLT